MADFHQSGQITTLHRLGENNLGQLEAELTRFAESRPLALILPSLASEMDGPALPGIIAELGKATYLNEIIVTLGQASQQDYKRAKEFFSSLPQPLFIIHNDGEPIQKLLAKLESQGVSVGIEGKGRAVWLAIGLILARGQSRCLALHDCDILSYDRSILGRLAYPLMSPRLDYQFCKGYYARVTHKMYGRVTRLFVAPLLKAFTSLLGPQPLIQFIESFRYPLSGEFAMDMDLARMNRIPADWGLEVGSLAEVFRQLHSRRVCQVDLCDTYEHKHQDLSAEDPEKGLSKMCTEIGSSLLRSLAAEGVQLTKGHLRSLQMVYLRKAEDMISSYAADAALNGLSYDRHEEELSLEVFHRGLLKATRDYLEDPRGQAALSNWNRVMSAAPGAMKYLMEAVDDNIS